MTLRKPSDDGPARHGRHILYLDQAAARAPHQEMSSTPRSPLVTQTGSAHDRAHQHEAADAVLTVLQGPAAGTVPERGLPTQVAMPTGSGNPRSPRRAHAN
ncbi:hypothetical protein ACF07W_15875 [Streptomyces sp. NPDC015140]